MRRLSVAGVVLLVLSVTSGASAQRQTSTPPSRAAVIAAATDVMQKARFCTLVTLGDDGSPQARVVDAFAPDSDMTVWIATNPQTRKVGQIRHDARVTLLYFDATRMGYVTVVGRAALVSDSAEKSSHWKEEWAGYYSNRNHGDDYLLIRVTPLRLEMVSPANGMAGEPWHPVMLDFAAPPATNR
jgi:PPOX class probable F420-dependent enzyme